MEALDTAPGMPVEAPNTHWSARRQDRWAGFGELQQRDGSHLGHIPGALGGEALNSQWSPRTHGGLCCQAAEGLRFPGAKWTHPGERRLCIHSQTFGAAAAHSCCVPTVVAALGVQACGSEPTSPSATPLRGTGFLAPTHPTRDHPEHRRQRNGRHSFSEKV